MKGMVVDAWQPTPRWHPYHWFGYDIRRWSLGYCISDDCWEYGKSQKIARDELRRLYAEG
jgi:hypothetical protein